MGRVSVCLQIGAIVILAAWLVGCDGSPRGGERIGVVDCTSASECGAQETCADGTCRAITACVVDDDCVVDTVCRGGRCEDGGGLSDPECEAGELRCMAPSTLQGCEDGVWVELCRTAGACESMTCAVARQDLQVRAASVSPSTVGPGGAVELTASVSLRGQEAVRGQLCTGRIAATREGADLLSWSYLPIDLEAGETASLDVRIEAPDDPGSYVIGVLCEFVRAEALDPSLALDNEAYLPLLVVDPGVPFELVVTHATVVAWPDGGQGVVRLEVEVCNQGSAPSPQFAVTVERGGDRLAEASFGALAPSACEVRVLSSGELQCEGAFEVVVEVSVMGAPSAGGRVVAPVSCDRCAPDRYDPDDLSEPPAAAASEPGLTLCALDIDRFVLGGVPTDGLLVELTETSGATPELSLWAETGADRAAVGPLTATQLGWFSGPLPFADRYVLELAATEPTTYDLAWAPFPLAPGTDYDVPALEVTSTVSTTSTVMTVDYVVENRGRAIDPAHSSVEVAFALSGEGPSGGQVLLGTFEHPKLAPGTRAAFSRQLPLNGRQVPGPRALIVTVDPAGQVPESDEGNNAARVALEIDGPPSRCADGLEPNDTMDTPAILQPGTTTELALCEEAEHDYYRFCLAAEQSATLLATSAGPEAGVDLLLHDDRGTLLTTDEGPGTTATLTVPTVFTPRCFTVDVRRDAPFEPLVVALYDLTLTLEGADLCADLFEPNDGFGEATWIDDLGAAPTRLCPAADVDLFFVELTAGQAAAVAVTAPSEVDLTVYGPDQAFMDTRRGRTPRLEWTAPADGNYFLRVSSADGAASAVFDIAVELP